MKLPELSIVGLVTLGFAAILPAALNARSNMGDADLGRELFDDWGCGDCHVLADAGAEGMIGPSLDGNPNLSYDFIISRITDGQGAMPPFGGQLSEEEIASLAAYVMEAAE